MSPKDVTVYMIGNAHIDPVWLWRWGEGLAEVLATCRSALDRMNEYPEFVFTRADAATYKWIEDSCPDMFEEIRRRVREGRWSIVGGWWEQPDCNIPSGESFVRHALYGKRYLMEKFGVDVTVGYNVDSFGHNAGLPQILSKSGIAYYVFMRPDAREKELPEPVFWWEGPDGSRVLALRLQSPYCTGGAELTQHFHASAANRAHGTTAAACFYGVGNHGGGPTIANIECIRRIQREPEAPTAVFGTVQQMFEHILKERTDFPVVKGDLQHHAVGCYSAHSEVKMWNRRTETALVNAEKFCSIAKAATGRPFPKEVFAASWRKVLFSQFHDVLAGTSLASAYDDVRDWYGAATAAADYESATALSAMASMIDVREDGQPFVVFNPHPHTVRAAVYVDEGSRALRDHTGREVAVQEAVPLFEHTGSRPTRVFVDYLPPLGYRLYYAGDWESFRAPGTLEAADYVMKNDFYCVEIDPSTGKIRQIVDDRVPHNLLSHPIGAVVLEDPSDTWSHGVRRYDAVAGRFGDAKIELIENGPVRVTYRIESRFGKSTLWQDVSLYMELPLIEFRVTVDWQEQRRALKFEFPLNISEPVATYDAAYAVVTQPVDGAENPGQKWIDVSGRCGDFSYGVSLINDGKYGFDVSEGVMRLTALRSPVYAFHDPRQIEDGKRYQYMDQGLSSFSFALLPHPGTWREADTPRQALLYNSPPVAVEAFRHSGEWPGVQSFGEVSEPNIDVCAMKESEDNDALIVRLYESAGKPTEAVLSLFGSAYPVSMGAFELKTLKVSDGKAIEVDLVEREVCRKSRHLSRA